MSNRRVSNSFGTTTIEEPNPAVLLEPGGIDPFSVMQRESFPLGFLKDHAPVLSAIILLNVVDILSDRPPVLLSERLADLRIPRSRVDLIAIRVVATDMN